MLPGMEEEAPLLRAMPRRPLYGLSGFSTRIDLAVLTAVADEGWCATASAIAADIDCKEVRIGVVVVRPGAAAPEGLVDGAGRLLLPVQIPPDVEGLPGFKKLAQTAARGRCLAVKGVEMAGYLNDDSTPDLRRVFVLVYRAAVPAGTPAPEGMTWIARPALAMSADSLSQLVQAAVS